jgi:hypothetical protein
MEPKDNAESWTYVTSKRNRASRRNTPLATDSTSRASPVLRTTANLSVKEIHSDYKRFDQQWSASECCRKLKELIASNPCCQSPTKAVCLGLGSFDPEDGAWLIRRRSHIQLAAFRTLVECIEQASSHKLRCIFQEPCFTASDMEFLRSLGYEILDSPKGFEEISEDSVVFGIHLYRDIYSSAIKDVIPALFIGTGYDVWERYA